LFNKSEKGDPIADSRADDDPGQIRARRWERAESRVNNFAGVRDSEEDLAPSPGPEVVQEPLGGQAGGLIDLAAGVTGSGGSLIVVHDTFDVLPLGGARVHRQV